MTKPHKTVAQIRQSFLDFFASKGHQVVESSSLVPHNDPTLLFTNAGMNQFKDLFLGLETRAYSRAVSSQRCVRAGGKHNDLENVGYTARHCTFFEMLGNFSFGDYFKRDAIKYAWELLTSEEWFGLPAEKLLVTVYHTDNEAFEIWNKEVGVPAEKIIRIGDNKGAPFASDNFWQMGDTGPCGPCSEIFYDHGDHIWGGPPGSPEEDGDRFIEIWNLVFMQFNRLNDGMLEPLPKPSIDTGMGLERLSAILQHVNSNYEIDVFQSLIKATADLLDIKDLDNKSLCVIADHIRSTSFLIADGVMPSNENRGYVLRRIIRRAIRHGNLIGAKDAFFYKLVKTLVDVMDSAGDNLKKHQSLIEQTLKTEEEQFTRTLDRGLILLDDELNKLNGSVLSGEVVFRLYDTFGFPVDLTADVCRERNITIDEAGFEIEMNKQRERARQASGFSTDYNAQIRTDSQTDFCGYASESIEAKVIAIYKNGESVQSITAEMTKDESAVIILDHTPFYAESGGQVGDTGTLSNSENQFDVLDTQKFNQAFGHLGQIKQGKLSVGDTINANVDHARRTNIRINHSATHLLHAALRNILGDHVAQKGSLVNSDSLRFDFSHPQAISEDELLTIETEVNNAIRHNFSINTDILPIEQAKARGAMALFGEKYSDEVRMLSIGDYSIELCGGTHTNQTGDIGLFKIISESGIAAGVRRIEAVTGQAALAKTQADEQQLSAISQLLKSDKSALLEKIKSQAERTKQLEKEIATLKASQLNNNKHSVLDQAVTVNNVKVLVHRIDEIEVKLLRTMIDDLKNQLGSAIIVLASFSQETQKVTLLAGVTKDLVAKYSAGALVGFLAEKIDGKGGGKPDLAQAGGTNIAALDKTLKTISSWVEKQ